MLEINNTQYHIVDTTLRDGAQSPFIMFSDREKIAIAEMLNEKGVYQIEAGIPAMGKSEQMIIKKIKSVCGNMKVSAWNRLNKNDVIASTGCNADIIHISVPVSQRQIHDKLKKDETWIIKKIEEVLSFAEDRANAITVGLEDASRADMDFIITVIKKVQQFSVNTVRYADTVGIMTPIAVYQQITQIIKKTNIEIEFHAHNDLGMAVANSIAAVQAGAAFIDTTVNGIGERCGNCDMDKFVFAASSTFNSGKSERVER
ncbi:beta/alpha barrel domain-containing protein [Pectinatus sottacetonis]|uniref:homocitrate synthase n=1 Tax=Pectinatus sottacetonis TaxID=1002795 RepID=UPI0018C608DC|nr:homocitrate synthase [Pectinatus sottacetonis]